MANAKSSYPVLRREHPLANGIIACWPHHDGSGPTLHDISGYDNHGALSAFASADPWTGWELGGAIDYDGAQQVITVPDSPELKPEHLSFSFWFELDAIVGFDSFVFKTTTTSWTDGFGIYLSGSNELVFFINSWNGNVARTVVTTGTRYHAIGTYDRQKIKLYVNGELKNEAAYTAAINHSSNVLKLGKGETTTPSNYSFDGRMSDVVIWNRALGEEEIKYLYHDSTSLYKPKESPIYLFISREHTTEAPSASLTLTANAPTITTTANVVAEIPAETISLTAFAPTLTNSGGDIDIRKTFQASAREYTFAAKSRTFTFNAGD